MNFGEVKDQGKRYSLTSGTAVLGRDGDCELCLLDNNISRKHVEMKIVPEGILVRDLGSTNGIEHLGRRIEQAVLQPGARIVVGRSVIDLLPLNRHPDHRHGQAAVRSFERQYLKQLMARHANNLSRAARIANIDRTYLRNLLKKHGLYKA